MERQKLIKSLKRKRSSIRASITREYGRIQEITEMDTSDKQDKLVIYEYLQGQIEELDSKIEENLNSLLEEVTDEEGVEQELDREYNEVQAYQFKILQMIGKCSPRVKMDMNTSQSPNRSSATIQSDLGRRQNMEASMLKAPTIPLPVYDSKMGEDIEKFFRIFEETVQKFGFSEYDKFQVLKKQINGRCSLLLESLEVGEQNYEVAKAMLLEAVASPVVRKRRGIAAVTELNMGSDDPFSYISKIRT